MYHLLLKLGVSTCTCRFARRETSCEQEDFYPKECYVKVNGKFITIPVSVM